MTPHGGISCATGVTWFRNLRVPIRREFLSKRPSQPKLGPRNALLFSRTLNETWCNCLACVAASVGHASKETLHEWAGGCIFIVDTERGAIQMRVQVRKWGNSLALRIPKPFADEAEVRDGTVVDLSLTEGKLVAVRVGAGKFTLTQLLRNVTKDNVHGEISFGDTAGREAW